MKNKIQFFRILLLTVLSTVMLNGCKKSNDNDMSTGSDETAELRSNAETPASFTVTRSADNLHLLTETKLGSETHRGRVLPVRNRSAAQLLSREMEILCNDQIYQEAVAMAARMIESK